MSKVVWRHLLLLGLLAFAPFLWQGVSQFHRGAPNLGWMEAFYAGALFALGNTGPASFFAVAAGIAVGASSTDARRVRTAVVVMAVTVAAMVVLDSIVVPSATRAAVAAAKRAAVSSETVWPSFFNDTLVHTRTDSIGYLRTGLSLLVERPAALSEPLGATWSHNHPRSRATDAAIFAATLLLPFIAIGMVLGVSAWMRTRVVFRAPRDEAVAKWISSWVLAAAVCGFIVAWSDSLSWRVLHGRNYWLPLQPYWPFVILAILGWRSAIREARSTAATHT